MQSTNKRKCAPGERDHYPVPESFVEWLEGGLGRGAHFRRIDPLLSPPMISKIKTGRIPITFEYAVRLERAQKPSKVPFKAIDIMTFAVDRELYLYVTGQAPAPEPDEIVRKPLGRPRNAADQFGA